MIDRFRNTAYKYLRFDSGSMGFLILLLGAQFFFNNGIYLFFGAIVFGLVGYHLQKPFRPAVFTIIFLYHFVQVSAGVWLSNYLGKDINFRSPYLGVATIASFVGLVMLFAPIIYFNNKIPVRDSEVLRKFANSLSTRKTFYAYLVAYFALNALGAMAFLFAGFTQLIFSLVKVKWMLLLLFGYQVILKKEMGKLFIFCCLLEFVSGLFSYFSDFKTVILFVICLLLTFLTSVSLRQIGVLIIGCVVLIFLGLVWTSIKGEYRQFLNQGSRTQTKQVSQEEAINKLIDLAQQGREDDGDPAVAFLDRLQYTFHLARTMENVPSNIRFQQGANWGESLEYALTPRVLNPEKPKFEATVKTRKYTGLAYAGQKQGASFSLGYFADGFIDFGLVGMMIPLLLLGWLYGSLYYYFLKNSSHNLVFNYAVVCAIFLEFMAFEMDSTFLIGRLFATTVMFLLLKIFFFPWLVSYLSVERKTAEISALAKAELNS